VEPLPRALILLGAVLVGVGLFMHFAGTWPLGRLPGDIRVERPGFRLYVPIVTCIVFSVVLSFVMWVVTRLR